MDNSTWSFHTSGIANISNPWPKLGQKNQTEHSARKEDSVNAAERRIISLDHMEYPQLGGTIVKTRNYTVIEEECLPCCNFRESKKWKTLKRYKRPEKICINLKEALRNTQYVNRINNKEFPKARINLSMGSLGFPVPNRLDGKKYSNFRRFELRISRDEKISKLKRIILSKRDMKAQINISERVTFDEEDREDRRIEAVCRDVDAINFNALRITVDPEIDVDYTRGMCTMTLYNNDYRIRNEINISDNTLCHRPDVIDKINTLKIQGRQLTYNNNQMVLSQAENDAMKNDIADQIFSLKIEEDVKQEPNAEIDDKSFKFSHNFREYCTNLLTTAFNDSLEKFLKEITRLQKRYHAKYPNKSQYKRRYYSGLKEVRKQAELRKLKFVIIAPDIEKVELEDGLDDQVDKLLEVCRRQNVVYGFGLRRRKLGYYTHGSGFVGCVGIANYSGVELLFKNVLTELVHARNAFKKLNGGQEGTIDISKVVSEDHLPSENINALLKILSHTCTVDRCKIRTKILA